MSTVGKAPSRAELLGVWELIAYSRTFVDTGQVVQLEASGQFVFTPGGYMSGITVESDRPRPDPGTMSDADRLRQYAGIMGAYAGRYELDGELLTNVIRVAWNAGWAGTRQVRRVSVEEGKLTIETSPRSGDGGGPAFVNTLVWKRVERFDEA